MNVDKYSRTNLSFDDKDVQKMIEWMKVHPDERPGPRWSDSFSELTFELERAPKSICRWMQQAHGCCDGNTASGVGTAHDGWQESAGAQE